MPSPGISLVGFMDQQQALEHLRSACVPPPNATDAQLIAEWTAAKAKLGAPVKNSGLPDIKDIPASHSAYVNALLQLPWVVAEFQGMMITAANVKLVEIEPLLAYQFFVDMSRSGQHCGHFTTQPSMDELLSICLPNNQPTEQYSWQQQDRSVIIKSRSLNLRMKQWGIGNGMPGLTLAGIMFGPSLPFVHVVRLNGKCLLFNGFHRAVGLRQAGATHVACVLRDVPDALNAGIADGRATFTEQLLMSNDPPTLRHYTQGLAADVQLRATSRILHVTWSDYVFPEE